MKLFRHAVVTVILSALSGAVYQQAGQARDRAELAPPGRLVAVGPGRMHLHCEGHGQPTVLLEAGATGFAQTWAWVQRDLVSHGRVCSYDRSGLGWSGVVRDGQDGESSARNLHDLLQQAGETGPFVMAGHSLGGPLVQIYAAMYPQQVVGIALVDPSHPDQLDRFPAAAREQQEDFHELLRVASLASHVGLTRLTNIVGQHAAGLPAQDYRAARMFGSSPAHLWESRDELLQWDRTMSAVRRATAAQSKPTVVISAGRTMDGMPEGFLPIVHELHRDIAARHGAAHHVVIEEADHFSLLMNKDHADRVAEAIQDLRRRAAVPITPARPDAQAAPTEGQSAG